MPSNVSITFKSKICSDLPDYVQKLNKLYDSFVFYEISISTNNKDSIKALLKSDVKWIEVMNKSATEFNKYLKQYLSTLEDFLRRWHEKESSSPGLNGYMNEELTEILERIRVLFLAIMIWRKP